MRFSILTPSHNYADYLPDCLESVARQEGVDVEHVVIDDGSTDNSVDILRAWPGPLRLEVQPNAGLSRTLNRALELATGDVIGWLNADDFYLPGALRAAAAAFEEDERADVVFGDSVFVDERARVLQLKPQHRMQPVILRSYDSFVAPCASFRRRTALPEPAWCEDMRTLMDWDQDLGLVAAGRRYRHIRLAVAAFRRHDKQQSALAAEGDAAEWELLVRRHSLPLRGRRKPLVSAAGHLLHAGFKLAAGSYARQARTRHLRGRDTRWWATEEGAETVRALQSR